MTRLVGDYQQLARQIAEDSIVTKAVARLIEQIVEVCGEHENTRVLEAVKAERQKWQKETNK